MHDFERFRTLKLKHARAGIGYGDGVTAPVSKQPSVQIAIRLHKPEPVVRQSKQNAVHEQAALMRAQKHVAAASRPQIRNSARAYSFQKGQYIRAGKFHRPFGHIEERRASPQRPIALDRIIAAVLRE